MYAGLGGASGCHMRNVHMIDRGIAGLGGRERTGFRTGADALRHTPGIRVCVLVIGIAASTSVGIGRPIAVIINVIALLHVPGIDVLIVIVTIVRGL